MKLISYCITSAVIAVAILWSVNELSILTGVQAHQKPEAMFIIPVCFIYFSVSLFFVYPATFSLAKSVGSLNAGVLSSVTPAIIIAAILYNPEVDNSRFLTIMLLSIIIGLPWFAGGLFGKHIIKLLWQKNDT